jgi:pullulanase/glycogen debranching enzyme
MGHAHQAPLAQFEDATIYDLHVRDFSISDEAVSEPLAAATARSPTATATACATCQASRAPG